MLTAKTPLCWFVVFVGWAVVVTSTDGRRFVSRVFFGLISFLAWLGYGAYLLRTEHAKEAVLLHMGYIVAAFAFLFCLLAIPVCLGISITGRGGVALPEEWVTSGLSTLVVSTVLAYCVLKHLHSSRT